jgi:hypothetical protein
VVRVRRIGFNAQYLSASLQAGETKTVEIVLDPGTVELPELSVTARSVKPIEYAWTTRYDDFFRRRQTGFGVYLTREDIDKRKPFRTPNLLVGIAGIRLRFYHSGPGGTDVEFSRCPRVSVWIDGQKQRFVAGTGLGLGELLERVLPSQIALMEVYRGPAEMPAEFLDDSCAAVGIWTR